MQSVHNRLAVGVMRCSRSLTAAALSAAFCLCLPLTLTAQTTWSGNGNADNSGNWSAASNWDGGTVPSVGDTAVLDNVTSGTRTVTYDAAADGTLGALQIVQSTTGALNVFDIRRSLVVDSPITIGASEGQSIVSFGNTAQKLTLTAMYPGVVINAGGTFIHDFITNSNQGNDLISHVVVNNGGIYQAGSSASGTSSASAQATITRSMTLNSGSSLVLDTASRSNLRLAVQGDFTANGATFSTTSGSGGSLFLDGTNNTLSNTSVGTVNINVRGNGAKNFSSDTAINRLYLVGRHNADLEVSVNATTVTGLYLTHESAGSTVGLKLDGNLALASNAVQLNASGGAGSGTTTYAVDTAGHTLDLSQGQNWGKWVANKGNETNAVWKLGNSGAAGTGVIRASAFDLSAANVQTDVESGTVLEAVSHTNTNGRASNLSGVGVIAEDSVFRFNAANPAHTGTLESSRTIGVLEVRNGTLGIIGEQDFTAAGGIVVSAGAVLDLGQRTVQSNLYTFGVSGSNIGKITGGTQAVVLDGVGITFVFSDSIAIGTYNMFDTAHHITGTPDFVAVNGLANVSLTRNVNLWYGSSNGYSFTFSVEAGELIVNQIPEAESVSLLLGVLSLGFCVYLRCRRP